MTTSSLEVDTQRLGAGAIGMCAHLRNAAEIVSGRLLPLTQGRPGIRSYPQLSLGPQKAGDRSAGRARNRLRRPTPLPLLRLSCFAGRWEDTVEVVPKNANTARRTRHAVLVWWRVAMDAEQRRAAALGVRRALAVLGGHCASCRRSAHRSTVSLEWPGRTRHRL